MSSVEGSVCIERTLRFHAVLAIFTAEGISEDDTPTSDTENNKVTSNGGVPNAECLPVDDAEKRGSQDVTKAEFEVC